MTQVSNNLIAGLIVVAIVISGFGFLTSVNLGNISFTGGATTGTGSANVTIGSSTDIELLRNAADFGSGALAGADRALTTQQDNYQTGSANDFDDGTEGNGTVYGSCDDTETNCAYPFVVRNSGNVNISLNISAVSEATSWIGTNAQAYVKGASNESGNACGLNFTNNAVGFGEGPWISLNATEGVICSHMKFSDSGADEVRVHFSLTVPSDASGSKSVLVTLGALAA